MSAKNNEQNALVTTGGYSQLENIDIAAMMTEELDGLDLSFERVKIPSGGATMFELPGEDGDESETVKEFSGVILHHHVLHAFYKDKYTGGSNPPRLRQFRRQDGNGYAGRRLSDLP